MRKIKMFTNEKALTFMALREFFNDFWSARNHKSIECWFKKNHD
ncbi:hypothetical protein CCAND95_90035 [Capnocytophaga canis]|nr:hypothetical protein CCAND95_90035 [Capnocytophaga canis]